MKNKKRVKLIDLKGFSRILTIGQLTRIIHLPTFYGPAISFSLFKLPKKGVPVYKEIIS